jgi:hypothetical protein
MVVGSGNVVLRAIIRSLEEVAGLMKAKNALDKTREDQEAEQTIMEIET